MVQRETAVLLAQRIEVLSTKSMREADAANELLQSDVAQWQQQAHALTEEAAWQSVDLKFPPQLDASRQQLLSVWEAFEGALFQAKAARDDANEPLPSVPVWAEELRMARGGQATDVAQAEAPATRGTQSDALGEANATTEAGTMEGKSAKTPELSALPRWTLLSAWHCAKQPIRSSPVPWPFWLLKPTKQI
jgi:hypothetical protein